MCNKKFNGGHDMKLILAIIATASLLIIAGCDTIPSAGVNANNSGVSTNAGWGPVSGGVNSNGGFGVNAH